MTEKLGRRETEAAAQGDAQHMGDQKKDKGTLQVSSTQTRMPATPALRNQGRRISSSLSHIPKSRFLDPYIFISRGGVRRGSEDSLQEWALFS